MLPSLPGETAGKQGFPAYQPDKAGREGAAWRFLIDSWENQRAHVQGARIPDLIDSWENGREVARLDLIAGQFLQAADPLFHRRVRGHE